MTATDQRPVPAFASVLSHVPDPQDRAVIASAMRLEVGRRSRAAATHWDALDVGCPRCATSLPSYAFARTSSRPNGLQPYCRSCSASVIAAKTRARSAARAAASAPA